MQEVLALSSEILHALQSLSSLVLWVVVASLLWERGGVLKELAL